MSLKKASIYSTEDIDFFIFKDEDYIISILDLWLNAGIDSFEEYYRLVLKSQNIGIFSRDNK